MPARCLAMDTQRPGQRNDHENQGHNRYQPSPTGRITGTGCAGGAGGSSPARPDDAGAGHDLHDL